MWAIATTLRPLTWMHTCWGGFPSLVGVLMEGRVIEGKRGEQGSSCHYSTALPEMADSEMEAALALADLAVIRGDDQQHTMGRAPDELERQWKVHKFLAKKAQKGCGSFNSNLQCSRTQRALGASAGSSHVAHEHDKEAKRMRRVLANRESARQTIRKRQALQEDLTKSVSELQLENVRLKIEKEFVTNEYQLLKDRNQNLRTWTMIASGKKVSSASESQIAVEMKRKSKKPASSLESLPPASYREKALPHLFLPSMAAHRAHPHLGVPPGSEGNVGVSSQIDPYKRLDHSRDVDSMMPFCLVPCSWLHSMPPDCCSHQFQPCPPRSSFDNAYLIPRTAEKRSLEMTREENWAPRHQHGMLEATRVSVGEYAKEEYARACECSSKTVIIAAEARKRRKEITKLKLQYYPNRRPRV